MTKLCTKCGTQVPFIANVCPNCTRDIAVNGGNDAQGAATLIVVLVLSAVVTGVVEIVKRIIGY